MAYWRDVVAAFTSAHVPLAQVRHPKDQAPPYAVAWRDGNSQLASDNRPLSEYTIYLYTKERDMALEFALEDALAELGVTYSKGATGHDGETDLVSIPFRDIAVYER